MVMGPLGEAFALVSVGTKAQQANKERYDGVEETVAFGDHPQQAAMVFLPPPSTHHRNSILFFLHGGAWQMGNPLTYRFMGRFFARLGFPTILGGYRLTPAYRFPTQLEDARDSLRAGAACLRQKGVKVERILLGGHSAGAQLAALLAYDQTVDVPERPLFSGLVAMSGILNFAAIRNRSIQQALKRYVGHLADPSIADPITYARPDMPLSVLCLHGGRDPVVAVESSTTFADRLNQGTTQRARVHIFPRRYHTDLLTLFFEPSSADTHPLTTWLEEVDNPPAKPLRG
jgi:acetyl esterase/lipase